MSQHEPAHISTHMLMYRNTQCLERGRTFVKGKPIPLYKYTPMHTHTQKLLVSLHLRASDPHRAMCRMRPTFRTRRCIINPLSAVQRAEIPAHLSLTLSLLLSVITHKHKTQTLYLLITHSFFTSPVLTFYALIITHTHTHTFCHRNTHLCTTLTLAQKPWCLPVSKWFPGVLKCTVSPILATVLPQTLTHIQSLLLSLSLSPISPSLSHTCWLFSAFCLLSSCLILLFPLPTLCFLLLLFASLSLSLTHIYAYSCTHTLSPLFFLSLFSPRIHRQLR